MSEREGHVASDVGDCTVYCGSGCDPEPVVIPPVIAEPRAREGHTPGECECGGLVGPHEPDAYCPPKSHSARERAREWLYPQLMMGLNEKDYNKLHGSLTAAFEAHGEEQMCIGAEKQSRLDFAARDQLRVELAQAKAGRERARKHRETAMDAADEARAELARVKAERDGARELLAGEAVDQGAELAALRERLAETEKQLRGGRRPGQGAGGRGCAG